MHTSKICHEHEWVPLASFITIHLIAIPYSAFMSTVVQTYVEEGVSAVDTGRIVALLLRIVRHRRRHRSPNFDVSKAPAAGAAKAAIGHTEGIPKGSGRGTWHTET